MGSEARNRMKYLGDPNMTATDKIELSRMNAAIEYVWKMRCLNMVARKMAVDEVGDSKSPEFVIKTNS